MTINGPPPGWVKPIVALDLGGEEGNAFRIVGTAQAAIREIDPNVAREYALKAVSGDYEHLMETTREYVDLIDTADAVREYVARRENADG